MAFDQGKATLVAAVKAMRSLEWLARRLGMTQSEVAKLLSSVGAHGVLMDDGHIETLECRAWRSGGPAPPA
jgi:DNA-binding IclR family transcriptional regulator